MPAIAPERENALKEIKTAVRHAAMYGAGNMAIRGLGFLMIPFYTRYLTPRDYGILEILDQSMTLFALILNMGMIPALLRSYSAAESPLEKRRVISTACLFGIVTGVLTFALGAAGVRSVTLLLFGPKVPAGFVLLAVASLVLGYMANSPRTYLRALEKPGAFTAVDTAGALLLLTLNIVFIAGMGLGPAGILWSSVVVNGLQFVTLSCWAFYRTGFGFSRRHLDGMLRFGVPLVFANLGLFVLNFSDRFFLQHYRSLEVVGIYALGYKFGYMMNYLVVQPFFTMWQSRMYNVHAQPDHINIFKQIFALYSLGLIYAGLAMSLFSSEVVRLMVEPKFAASQDVIPVVVLAYIFYGLSYFAQLGLFLTDRTKPIGIIGVLAAGVNLALNFFMIRAFGMMGAAFATLLSFAFLAGASYWRSQLVFRLPLGVGRTLAAMTVAVGLYLGCRWWAPSSLGLVILIKIGVLAAFPVAMWKSGILPPGSADILLSARNKGMMAAGRFFGVAAPGAAAQ